MDKFPHLNHFPLLIATTNPGKFQEIKAALNSLPFKFIFLPDLKLSTEFTETEATYEKNALAKARHFAKLTGLSTLGEDSGIEVEALKDELGVKTRRWGAGEKATDEEWISYFLKRMEAFPHIWQRRAKFISVVALVRGQEEGIRKKGSVIRVQGSGGKFFKGEASGVITLSLQSPLKAGIPLSSCFLPDGCSKVYAALTAKEKAGVSHRGRALEKLVRYLNPNDKNP